jgi:hypothetical protein
MQWDDLVHEGERGEWKWLVSREPIIGLAELTASEHLNCRLWIATFDSGKITPSAEELAIGWKLIDGIMVSPPLTSETTIPSDCYDEWYVFDGDHSTFGVAERFVSFGSFTLADPRKMAATFDPTWEISGLDWLYPIQERFWSQVDRHFPLSYIASGDNDIVVTRKPGFAARVRQAIA